MKINEYEAGMLDTVLEAFGVNDSLTRAQLVELFDGDEPLAHAIVSLLLDSKMVNAIGYTEAAELPMLITREPKAVLLMKDGGFTAQYRAAETVADRQVETEKLQHEIILYEQRLQEKDARIKNLELQNKRFKLLKNVLWLIGLADIGLIIWVLKLMSK